MSHVPNWQRRIHIATEAIAVAVFVPWLLAAAKAAPEPHKGRLKLMAVGALVVDGYLLYRWLVAPELQPRPEPEGRVLSIQEQKPANPWPTRDQGGRAAFRTRLGG